MLTRRTVLHLAAAAAAARAPLSTITPAEAAHLLAEPATPVPKPDFLGWGESPDFADPVSFALDTERSIAEELIDLQAPEELATYVQARAAVLRDLPILAALPCDHSWHKVDEAAFAWAGAAYMKGVAAGAAYENLRRALVGPTRPCPTCFGVGRVDEDGKRAMTGGGATCAPCAGIGTVAVRGPNI